MQDNTVQNQSLFHKKDPGLPDFRKPKRTCAGYSIAYCTRDQGFVQCWRLRYLCETSSPVHIARAASSWIHTADFRDLHAGQFEFRQQKLQCSQWMEHAFKSVSVFRTVCSRWVTQRQLPSLTWNAGRWGQLQVPFWLLPWNKGIGWAKEWSRTSQILSWLDAGHEGKRAPGSTVG